jgi:hypothetical protein
MFNKACDTELQFTGDELAMMQHARSFSFITRKQDFVHMDEAKKEQERGNIEKINKENVRLWGTFLRRPEAHQYPKQFLVEADGGIIIQAPNAYIKPWMASFCAYAAEQVIQLGKIDAIITSDDAEVTDEINRLLKSVRDARRADQLKSDLNSKLFMNPQQIESALQELVALLVHSDTIVREHAIFALQVFYYGDSNKSVPPGVSAFLLNELTKYMDEYRQNNDVIVYVLQALRFVLRGKDNAASVPVPQEVINFCLKDGQLTHFIASSQEAVSNAAANAFLQLIRYQEISQSVLDETARGLLGHTDNENSYVVANVFRCLNPMFYRVDRSLQPTIKSLAQRFADRFSEAREIAVLTPFLVKAGTIPVEIAGGIIVITPAIDIALDQAN